jgi:hypothetical protein
MWTATLLASTLVLGAPARGAARPPETCAVTRPAAAFVPPAPHEARPPLAGRFWYGTADLWAMPHSDGIWEGNVTPRGRRDKVFWWSRNWNWRKDTRPRLTVTARRLDGPAPSLRVSRATNAHAADIGHAMLVALDIPTAGCWKITGTYKRKKLSYVVWAP